MLSPKLEKLCVMHSINTEKLPIVKVRVEKMLKRKPTEEVFEKQPTKRPPLCPDCLTTNWEDTVIDPVLASLICLKCGLELNSGLPFEMMETHPQILQQYDLYSAQRDFSSKMTGGSKILRAINSMVEDNMRSEDGKTREKYKNDHRTYLYDTLERWGEDVGINEEVLLQAKNLVHSLRTNAARLHSPLLALLVCLIMAERTLRKEETDQEVPVPTPSPSHYRPVKTSKRKWIDELLRDIEGGHGSSCSSTTS
jgi:hypothetical protein